MLKIKVNKKKDALKKADLIDRIVFSDKLDKLPAKLKPFAAAAKFEGKSGSSLLVPGAGDKNEILIGLGESSEVDAAAVRLAAANLIKAAPAGSIVGTNLATALGKADESEALAAVVEGARLGSYKYSAHKGSKPKDNKDVAELVVLSDIAPKVASAADAVAGAVNLARDLGNEPGGSLYPEEFAKIAKKVAKASGITCEVWNKARIVKEKLGGVLAVNQGSEYEPRVVKLGYKPAKKSSVHVVLVGKGITFDSGGLSIKSAKGMQVMKIDMAGGAAVLAAMSALKASGCPINVSGIIPLTDNMTGGLAQRPGDVFTARNGKTVEVLNTDAEGRLILADGLSLAAEEKPDAIIDIATLTGSVSVALGMAYSGVMGSSDEVTGKIIASSEKVGEPMWRLPLPDSYRSQLDSFVADIKNIGSGPYGGTLVAGIFLSEFVGDVPWGHIDLGISAFNEAPDGVDPKGATGASVRTLVDTLVNW